MHNKDTEARLSGKSGKCVRRIIDAHTVYNKLVVINFRLNGSTLSVQIPSSPFVNGTGFDAFSPSRIFPERRISRASGALTLKITI